MSEVCFSKDLLKNNSVEEEVDIGDGMGNRIT